MAAEEGMRSGVNQIGKGSYELKSLLSMVHALITANPHQVSRLAFVSFKELSLAAVVLWCPVSFSSHFHSSNTYGDMSPDQHRERQRTPMR